MFDSSILQKNNIQKQKIYLTKLLLNDRAHFSFGETILKNVNDDDFPRFVSAKRKSNF